VLVFHVVRYVIHDWRVALFSVVALAVSHTFWIYAVVPKPYTQNTLFLILIVYCLLRWRADGGFWPLALSAFIFGLSPLNHLVLLTAAPGILLFIALAPRERKRPAHLLMAAVLFLLGLIPFLWMTWRDQQAGMTSGFIIGSLRGFLDLLVSPSELAFGLAIWFLALGYQFFFVLIPGALGLHWSFRNDLPLAFLLLLIYLGDVAFVLVPPPPGPIMMHWHLYITSYVIFTLWAGFGLAVLLPRLRRWLTGPRLGVVTALLVVVPPVLTYTLIPYLARPYTARLGVRDLPGRDTATFLFTPWKHGETGARWFGLTVLDSLPPHAVIFSDWTPHAVLEYLQTVEGRRPDVTLVNLLVPQEQQVDLIRSYATQERPLFLANTEKYYDVEGLKRYFEIRPFGPVYQLVQR
jgi:hypothetical protein